MAASFASLAPAQLSIHHCLAQRLSSHRPLERDLTSLCWFQIALVSIENRCRNHHRYRSTRGRMRFYFRKKSSVNNLDSSFRNTRSLSPPVFARWAKECMLCAVSANYKACDWPGRIALAQGWRTIAWPVRCRPKMPQIRRGRTRTPPLLNPIAPTERTFSQLHRHTSGWRKSRTALVFNASNPFAAKIRSTSGSKVCEAPSDRKNWR